MATTAHQFQIQQLCHQRERSAKHTNHVSTQIPYAVTVAVISFITYIIAGALQKAAGLGWLALPIGIILMVATVVGIKVLTAGKEVAE